MTNSHDAERTIIYLRKANPATGQLEDVPYLLDRGKIYPVEENVRNPDEPVPAKPGFE